MNLGYKFWRVGSGAKRSLYRTSERGKGLRTVWNDNPEHESGRRVCQALAASFYTPHDELDEGADAEVKEEDAAEQEKSVGVLFAAREQVLGEAGLRRCVKNVEPPEQNGDENGDEKADPVRRAGKSFAEGEGGPDAEGELETAGEETGSVDEEFHERTNDD